MPSSEEVEWSSWTNLHLVLPASTNPVLFSPNLAPTNTLRSTSIRISKYIHKDISTSIRISTSLNALLLAHLGMDPYSRRFTWNVIRQHREGRVIVLTTHFMDEAGELSLSLAFSFSFSFSFSHSLSCLLCHCLFLSHSLSLSLSLTLTLSLPFSLTLFFSSFFSSFFRPSWGPYCHHGGRQAALLRLFSVSQG